MEQPVTLSRRKGSARNRRGRAIRSPYTTEACQECRRRRAKCDGTRPLCGRCLRHGVECKFTGRDDSRGTAPKSLVILLQSRIDLLEQVLWLHSIDVNASIAKLQAGCNSSPGATGNVNDQSTLSSASLRPQSAEPDGALCSKESFGLEDDGEVSYFGSSSGRVELLQSNGLSTDPAHLMSPSTVRSRLNQFCQEIESTSEVSEELQEHLLTLYFEWEQPWFPLVDETLFRQSIEVKGRYFSPLLLNCLLAIGCRYSDRPEVRSVQDDPNTAGQTFLEIAEVLLHFDLQSPSITTIQSLGVLSMMYVATGSDSKAWLRHGMAVQLALDMGFNLNGSSLHKSHVLPDAEVKLRRQIYWALYCTDKMWANYTGRVCTMLDSQASIELPLPPTVTEDYVAQREPALVLLNSLSTQCLILENILMNLYAPKKIALGIQREAFLDSCLLDLKSWKYRLPSDLHINTAGRSNTKVAPHVYILHMVYHTSLTMLAKPFLPPRYKRKPKEESFTDAQSHTYTKGAGETAAALCMDAAREICLLGEQYRKAFGSFRQSPVTATHCTLSAVLFFIFNLDQCKKDGRDGDYESNKISKLINSGIVTLGELATSWTPARHYWRALLAILKDRQQLHSKGPDEYVDLNDAPLLPDPAVPELTLEGLDESAWNNAMNVDDIGDFADVQMWDNIGNSSFLGLGIESFFDDLPRGFDPFSSENLVPWFAS